MRTLRCTFALVLMLVVMAPLAQAQSVTVHRTFFTAWKYSLDGEEYFKVGTRADDLRLIMKNCRTCVSYLRRYTAHMTAARITGAVSVFSLSVPLIGRLRTGEWAGGYTEMMIVGASLGVMSVVLEAVGSRSLKKAVRSYNAFTPALRSPRSPRGMSAVRPGVGWTVLTIPF